MRLLTLRVCNAARTNTDLNECKGENGGHDCNGNNEHCENKPGTFACTCDTGFRENDKNVCENVDECADSNLNTCAHTCSDNDGSFLCSCKNGFALQADKKSCNGQ